jgi:ribosomal protein L11 methyltransferase
MSAEWQTQSAESWKLTLPCTKAEAEALALAEPEFDGLDYPPVLMTSEPDPSNEEEWQLDVYLAEAPDDALVARLRALVPSAADVPARIERIGDADWVTISQRWLEPIRAGRFFVHTAAYADAVPAGAVAFHIEASRAFGTGHHETTAGCLELLDRWADAGKRFADIADIGTGTGLLAFAARALWPESRVIASDIDPISIEVTAENMAVNGIAADTIRLVAADGMADPALAEAAPFDLLIANILAGPLIELAPDFSAAVAPKGHILLAGLLASQADDVLNAYAARGFTLAERIDRGDWSILGLVQAR